MTQPILNMIDNDTIFDVPAPRTVRATIRQIDPRLSVPLVIIFFIVLPIMLAASGSN